MTSVPARQPGWRPILDGSLRERAYEIVETIVAALTSAPVTAADAGRDPFTAILFLEAARALDAPALLQRAVEHANAAVQSLTSGRAPMALYGGVSGTGWLTCWMKEQLTNETVLPRGGQSLQLIDACGTIDAILLRVVGDSRPAPAEYDLLSGLVGIGIYAMRRRPAPDADRLLQSVLARLEQTAERTPDGATWLTRPELLPPHIRAEAPAGLYNLGVAHGVPGVIALLGHVHALGQPSRAVARLTEGAVTWTLAQQLSHADGARYANWVVPGTPSQPARLAWCYGGLGVSAAMMIVARTARQPALEDQVLRFARLEANRDPARSGVQDACLCHGAAGNGLIFQRLYAATGERCFHDAALGSFELALQMWKSGDGVGGYRFLQRDRFADDASFLSGSAGVALGLLAATRPEAPSWDRLLLTDIPARAA